MSKDQPLVDVDQVKSDIQTLSREPFRDELARLLNCAPDKDSLILFANKHPDKWAQSINVLSKLSGYQDNTAPIGDTNIYMQINQLPDSSLQHELIETLKELKIDESGELIEIKADPA